LVPSRERRGAGHDDDPRVVLPGVLRRLAVRATADRRAARRRGYVGARAVPLGTTGCPRGGPRAGARGEATATGAGVGERAARTRVRHGRHGAEATATDRGARGAA